MSLGKQKKVWFMKLEIISETLSLTPPKLEV